MAVRKIGKARRKSVSGSKKRKTGTRRRRRISGIGSIDVMGILTTGAEVGAGVSAARLLNTILVKQFPTLAASPMESAIIQFLAGGALMAFVPGNKTVANIGAGMMGNGVMVELVNLGLISGTGSDRMQYKINGTGGAGMNKYVNAIAGAGQAKLFAAVNAPSRVAGLNFNGSAIAGLNYKGSAISGGGGKCM
jgi:hypothetical protein